MTIPVLLGLIVFFFLLSAFSSASETALFASNRYKLKHLSAQGNRRATRVMGLVEHPENLLATILLMNNFANIGAASASSVLVSQLVVDEYRDLFLGVQAVVLTVVVLLFCELAPKAAAARLPERLALRVVVPIEWCMRIFSPLTRPSLKFAGLFYGRVKGVTESAGSGLSAAEIRTLLTGHKQERLNMLERVLDFSELQIKDVMIPRLEVTALDLDMSFQQILQVVETTRYSRFPVYQGTLDNIVGILHGKDLMPYLHSPWSFRLQALLRKSVFIPDTARLNNSIRLLQNAQTHMGIVVDEHGGIEGIVTIEDLVEQIVGEIQDEHDVEVDQIAPQVDGSLLIDAAISVREANERLHVGIPENGHYVTLAGFLLAETGRLLNEGEQVDFGGYRFKVEQRVGRRLVRVRMKKLPATLKEGPVAATQGSA